MARTKKDAQKLKGNARVSSGGKAPKVVARIPPSIAVAVASAAGIGGIKKPRRWRQGTVALREIRKYQKSTETLIPIANFRSLSRELIHNAADDLTGRGNEVRVSANAFNALQQAAEEYAIDMFKGAHDIMLFATEPQLAYNTPGEEVAEALAKRQGKRRTTIQVSDIRAFMWSNDRTNLAYAPLGTRPM